MKTSELTGAALDWAVAQAQGLDYEIVDGTVVTGAKRYEAKSSHDYYGCEFDEVFAPSTDWAQGGQIIEREKIGFWAYTLDEEGNENPGWYSETFEGFVNCGPTPLIAAMRCYVSSKLGEEVEIPEELK